MADGVFDERDLRWDIYREVKVTVRVTHVPSGMSATSDRQATQHFAKNQALARLIHDYVKAGRPAGPPIINKGDS